MKNYFALVDKDPDSAFGIRFPDIPGCLSAADAAEDIVPNAVEALQSWQMPFQSRPTTKRLSRFRTYATRSPKEPIWSRCRCIDNDSAVVRANADVRARRFAGDRHAARERGITRSAFLSSAARKKSSQSTKAKFGTAIYTRSMW